MRRSTRKIALVYPLSVPWIGRCLDGVRRYAREQGGWHLFTSPPTSDGMEESTLTLRSMRGWRGDAIIAASNDVNELRAARKMGIPVVNLAGGLSRSHGIPRVMVNHRLAGRLAADHLLHKGLPHLAFFGRAGVWYSDERWLGFRQRAEECDVPCEVFLSSPEEEARQGWTDRIGRVVAWLKTLPQPTGVFAVHDHRAQLLIEASQEADRRIPEDIAVIGMDNDETVCEHSVPTLTSVSRSSERVGWEAAALLDRLMQGASPPREDLLVEPDGLVARQSTDTSYCADPVVLRAMSYMTSHLQNSFNIGDIAEHAAVSKRTLEIRFRQSFRSSPHEHLTRLRVRHAQTLMLMPQKRTLEQLAVECGFGTPPTFYAAFRRVTGQSPTEFRKSQIQTK